MGTCPKDTSQLEGAPTGQVRDHANIKIIVILDWINVGKHKTILIAVKELEI